MQKHSAWTLLELMITVAVVALLASIAVPSYRTFWVRHQSMDAGTVFARFLEYARSEAKVQGTPVTVCAVATANNATTCQTDGGFSADDWRNGWIAFTDSDSDGIIADAADILQVHQAQDTILTWTAPAGRVTFSALGVPTTGVGSFSIQSSEACDSGLDGRQITVTASGQVQTARIACS